MQLAAGLVTLPWCRFPFERKHLTAVCCDCCASASRCGPLSFASPRQGSLFQAPFRFQALFEGCAPFLSSLPRQGSFPSGEGHPFRLFRLLGPQRGRDASSKQRPFIFFTSRISSFAKCMSGQPASDCVCLAGMHRRRTVAAGISLHLRLGQTRFS